MDVGKICTFCVNQNYFFHRCEMNDDLEKKSIVNAEKLFTLVLLVLSKLAEIFFTNPTTLKVGESKIKIHYEFYILINGTWLFKPSPLFYVLISEI